MYVKGPILPLLPRKEDIADFKCRIFHDGQFRPNCKVCNIVGHQDGDKDCPSRNTGPPVIPFHSHRNILSNFFPCRIEVDNLVLNSVEHGYQYYQATAAGMNDLADEIMRAPHAGKAKGLSKRIPSEFRENWEKTNTNKMRELIAAKLAQVPDFESVLLESADCVLAEATPDKFWASGLSSDTTSKTHPDSWSGLNTLGKLLMEVRDNTLQNLSADDEDDDEVSNVQSPASHEVFQNHSPQISSDTTEHSKTSTGMDSVRKTSLSDTKATTSSSVMQFSQSTAKLIQRTLKLPTQMPEQRDHQLDNQNLKKRKSSKTPEKEKFNKLKKFIHKK